MDILGLLLITICIMSYIYHALVIYSTFKFYEYLEAKKKKEYRRRNLPKVVCFKPLCGEDKNMFFNLMHFVEQDYPNFKVLLGIENNRDPAYKIAQEMKKYFSYQVILAVGEEGSGSNKKVRNMMNMERYIPSDTDILIISDSDARVTKNYIKSMIEPMLDDPKVGATTAIYRTIEDVDLPEIIEAIHIETNFIPSVLVASKLGPIKYAFGASIAIRMDVLKRIGGFASIKDYLADDYMLAKKIIEAGYKIKLAPYIVSIIPSTKTVKDAIIHVLRWYRTIKVCNPIGYFFSVICYPTFWAILNSIYLHGSFTSAFMLLLAIFFRMASSISVLLLLDTDIYRSFTNPLSDIISVFIWIWSFLGNKVQWRGKTYKVFFDGRVIQLE